MCLSNVYGGLCVAEFDIECFKILRVKCFGFYSIYYNMRYRMNNNIKISDLKYYPSLNTVEEGLHTFKHYSDAYEFCDYLNQAMHGVFKVVRVIIPKGATYYQGFFEVYHAYASDSLFLPQQNID